MTSLALALLLSLASPTAGIEPLVFFDFEQGLANEGSLGGSGRFKTYAAGEEAGFDQGPFGACLDLTAASRHGGMGPKEPPAGGAVLYRHPALDKLTQFTIVLWFRQSPTAQGQNARLLFKDGGWDLLPHAGGAAFSLGAGSAKTTYNLVGKHRQKLENTWRFLAIAVDPETIASFTGGQAFPLSLAASLPRREHTAAAPGELTLGTLGGIRPFQGWIDRVRVYASALGEKEIQAIFADDLAAAKAHPPIPVQALVRPAANTHRFHLKRSDIPFSTRWQKRTEAPAVMQSFHTTQCLWVYGSDPAFIQKIKNLGIGYEGTLNGLQGQERSTTNRSNAGDPTGRHEDLDGNKNTPSWMVTFGPRTFTGCCNHPAFRELFFQAAKQLIDRGVDMLHVDDWAMNASWVLQGVCFCDACRAGFRDWLAKHATSDELNKLGVTDVSKFDYREHLKRHGVPDAATYRERFSQLPLTPQFVDFQVQSMRQFFADFRRQLDAWSPKKYIPVSVNSLFTSFHPQHNLCGLGVVDFYVGESSQNADYQTEAEHIFAAKAAEAFGLTQVVSPIPRSTARTRAALATTYALGQNYLVPWDIYMGSDATGIQPRYFGTREQYGADYDFIHANARLLDEYQPIAELGVLVNADAPGGSVAQICQRLAQAQVPFHLIVGASRYGRMPVRAADLAACRVIVEFSSADSFSPEDQKTILAARQSRRTRFVPRSTDLAALCRLRGLELLRVEGPERIYAFPRVNPRDRSVVVHLVNWNLGSDGEQGPRYGNVTLTLLQPARWGRPASIRYYRPGEKPVPIEPETHDDCLRLTLPAIATWGFVEMK